jgi:Tfp pilus assembly protein PilP
MIAVVVNAANKAYFLRENDPIFNGFVARITDDSMVLRETVQDVLGRKSTRDVVKKLFVPAV